MQIVTLNWTVLRVSTSFADPPPSPEGSLAAASDGQGAAVADGATATLARGGAPDDADVPCSCSYRCSASSHAWRVAKTPATIPRKPIRRRTRPDRRLRDRTGAYGLGAGYGVRVTGLGIDGGTGGLATGGAGTVVLATGRGGGAVGGTTAGGGADETKPGAATGAVRPAGRGAVVPYGSGAGLIVESSRRRPGNGAGGVAGGAAGRTTRRGLVGPLPLGPAPAVDPGRPAPEAQGGDGGLPALVSFLTLGRADSGLAGVADSARSS